jgi:hypothetical protein
MKSIILIDLEEWEKKMEQANINTEEFKSLTNLIRTQLKSHIKKLKLIAVLKAKLTILKNNN